MRAPSDTPHAARTTAALEFQQDRPLLGILLMSMAMLVVPLLDACAKILSQDYPVLQVSWGRFAFHFLWLLPLVSWHRYRWWRTPSMPWTQGLRSVFLLLATVCLFLAIRGNQIPTALALLFISPLVVTLLAP